MIRVRADGSDLLERLRKRVADLVQGIANPKAKRSVLRRADWRSATALWPDFTGDQSDGK